MKKLLFIIPLLLCFCLSGCHQGVAATVNGVDITDEQVDASINEFRSVNNLSDDEAWKSYLNQNLKTEKSNRNDVIESLINDEVIKCIAKDKNITVSKEEIEKEAEFGYNEKSLLEYKVKRTLIDEAEVPASSLGKFFLQYGEKLNGSIGYNQIIIPENQPDKANQIYSDIKQGKISFDECCRNIVASGDIPFNFDYVVYDCCIKNPDKVTARIKTLNIGETSELIHDGGYYYILKVVDKIQTNDSPVSMNSLPEFTQDNIKTYVKIIDGESIYKSELEKYKKQMSITKF